MQPDKLDFTQVVAMGVGAMVGGGIFSVLGLAMTQAGHAAPLAFVAGGLIALLTGWSYAKLGLAYRSEGGSFTYLEQAFGHGHFAGLGGWLLLVGYIGTMALYAYTFGVYGAALLGESGAGSLAHHFLQSLVLLTFLGINLYGIRETGNAELLLVTIKVLILALFGGMGLLYMQPERIVPLFNKGYLGVITGAALIFVAYEGFELIPNAVNEMRAPERDLSRGILWSIVITIFIYVLVSLVAAGNLSVDEVQKYGEYALAMAAKPLLGNSGFVLIGLAALFSAASAINATLFGTARLGTAMAQRERLPRVFCLRRQQNGIPWVSLVVISAVTLMFVNLADLQAISAFASSTFLLLFAVINLSALKLRSAIGIEAWVPLGGLLFALSSWVVLMVYLYQHEPQNLAWLAIFYIATVFAETLFSQRSPLMKRFLHDR